jgi:hypothetical protein
MVRDLAHDSLPAAETEISGAEPTFHVIVFFYF